MELAPFSRPAESMALAQQPASLVTLAEREPSGTIAAEVRAVSLDVTRRVATCELLVANDSRSPVAVVAYVARSSRKATTFSTATVPALDSGAVALEVPLHANARGERITVELRSESTRFSLDVEAPAPRRSMRRQFAVAGAIALLGSGLAGYAAKPKIVALAAPTSVVAGRNFDVAYALGGVGKGTYAIETPEGLQMRRGTLGERSGSFNVDVPAAAAVRAYELRVATQGAFGSDARVARFEAVPAPSVLAAPAIRERIRVVAAPAVPTLTLTQSKVRSGAPIALAFLSGTAGGTARLVDQTGATRATALLDPSGAATLVAPVVPVDQEFRVVARVERGTSVLESEAGVIVAAAQKPNAAPSPASGATAHDSGAADGAPFSLDRAAIPGGSRLPVSILRDEARLRLALTGSKGNEIGAVDVPAGAKRVELAIPKVARAQDDLVVATFERGAGQETVVRPLHVSVANAN